MEQPLRMSWPSWRPPPGNGAVALALGSGTRGFDALLAREGARSVVWAAAAGVPPEVRGLDVVGREGVVAATVARAGTDARRVGMALEFARRLVERRDHATGRDPGACLTSWPVPDPPEGMVRVPHLVTVSRGGHLSDAVVWEVLAPEAAERWLGCPVSATDLGFVEGNLDALLRLRAAARDGRLPATAAVTRLLTVLPPGGELSIALVFQRSALFRAMLP